MIIKRIGVESCMKKKICGVLNSSKNIFLKVVKLINKNKKKVVMGLSVFLVVFISVFSFINLRYPTKINAYIAHVINKGEPANSYFDDENFYKAVVDAYNKENNTSLSYTTNLTDEQLKSIKSVSYWGNQKSDSEKIRSTTGIEKLTALTYLYLGWNNLSSIDLSNNISLTYLHLHNNNLSSIDLSKNTNLTKLELYSNNLSSINLSNNIFLTYLNLGNNKISSIDLSKNNSLTELKLYANNLSSIDLSKNTSLTYLDLDSNKLSSIDLSKNTNLTFLGLRSNKLSSIDLSKNTNLTSLDLSYNNLSSIDLSRNIKLSYLELSDNKISSIDLSKNTSLTSLHLDNNNLSSIKLYDNFDISGVSKTIGKQSAYQTSIDLGSNRIINLIKSYKYYYSSKIVIPSEVDIQTFINNLGLQNLTSKVFNNDEETSSGKVKEGYILKLYYEDTEVDSVPIKIFENSVFDDEFFYKAVVDAYNRENKTSLPYTTNLTDEQLKSIKIVSYWGNQKSDSEKIRSTTGIEKLTALTYLYLGWNNLSSIDLSKNTNLTSLGLRSNKLSSIDLSKNTFLTYLYLENNELSNIDLSKNTKLTTLHLYNNPLKLNAYVKENGTLTSSSIKMPEGSDKFYLTYEIEDNSIANFADNRLNGLKVGKTSATVTLNGVKASSSSTENMKVDGTITVFDRLKGDISNDDKITIADVSLLYRHVRGTKVIEDSKTLEISDLTGDGKITIADVAKLYRYVRGKITEL